MKNGVIFTVHVEYKICYQKVNPYYATGLESVDKFE